MGNIGAINITNWGPLATKVILTTAAFLFNVIDYHMTCWSVLLSHNNYSSTVSPLVLLYSNCRGGQYHQQYLLEFKLLFYTASMMYVHWLCSNLIEFRLLVYNLSMAGLVTNNMLTICCLLATRA